MCAYVQLQNLRRWPYRRLSPADQHVIKRFFDVEDFFAHGWDIFHYENDGRNFVLLGVEQIQRFFDLVRSETGLAAFKNVNYKPLLFNVGSAEPVFVATVNSKAEYDNLTADFDGPVDGGEKTNKGNKSKARLEKRQRNQTGWRDQIRATRKYLGFGTTAFSDGSGEAKWADDDSIYDTDAPVVFVCIDVEAYERNQNIITEIGISTLDTADVQSLGPPAPGLSRSDAIVSLITTRHLRITENRNYRNGVFVTDAADRFDFGTSEWVSIEDAPKVVAECFRHPDAAGNMKKCVLVGHDIKGDIDYLRIIGYDVMNVNGLRTMDTGLCWRAVRSELNSRALSGVLTELGVEFWNLHNAGNDAAYTLIALVKIAEMGIPPPSKESPSQEAQTATPSAQGLGSVPRFDVGWGDPGDPVPVKSQQQQ